MTSATTNALSVTDLHVSRGGKPVLHGVSLQVAPGEIVALLGPNGAGKSTLVMAIAGLLAVDSGAVMLGGTRLTGRAPHDIRRSGVAAVIEGHKVLGNLTVAENLACAGAMLPAAAVAEGSARALEVFPELKVKLASRAGDLSGGQQQMLSVAQAMISHPRFILADELSLGLAPTIVNSFVPVLERLADSGVGILLIEQYTALALRLAHRVALMTRGRLARVDDAAVFRRDPGLVAEVYLSA